MKKTVVILLMIVLLTGCSRDKTEMKAEGFITKMIDFDTYSGTDENKDQIPDSLEPYFSEEGYKTLIDNQMGFIYPEFFKINKVTKTKNIKIKEVSKIKGKEGSSYQYKVQYVILCKNKKTKMEDKLAIKINSKNEITEVIILNTSDVMHKLFLDVKVQ